MLLCTFSWRCSSPWPSRGAIRNSGEVNWTWLLEVYPNESRRCDDYRIYQSPGPLGKNFADKTWWRSGSCESVQNCWWEVEKCFLAVRNMALERLSFLWFAISKSLGRCFRFVECKNIPVTCKTFIFRTCTLMMSAKCKYMFPYLGTHKKPYWR